MSKVFRAVFFVAGIGIIGAAFFLFKPAGELSEAQNFLWVNILIVYLLVALPVLLIRVSTKTVDKKTPLLTILYSNLWWILLGIALLIAGTLTNILAIKVSIILEVILFFIFLGFVCIGFFANAHVSHVMKKEETLLSPIKEIRASMNILSVLAVNFDESLSAEKNKIEQLNEMARYISPVENDEAINLEHKILQKIKETQSNVESVSQETFKIALKKDLSDLETLFNMRKLLRN